MVEPEREETQKRVRYEQRAGTTETRQVEPLRSRHGAAAAVLAHDHVDQRCREREIEQRQERARCFLSEGALGDGALERDRVGPEQHVREAPPQHHVQQPLLAASLVGPLPSAVAVHAQKAPVLRKGVLKLEDYERRHQDGQAHRKARQPQAKRHDEEQECEVLPSDRPVGFALGGTQVAVAEPAQIRHHEVRRHREDAEREHAHRKRRR